MTKVTETDAPMDVRGEHRPRNAAPRTDAQPLSGLGRTIFDLKNPSFTSFLDLARWVSAWIVFLGHLRNPLFLGFEDVATADRGFLIDVWYFVTGWFGEAVIVFFVLSGFLVGASACAKARFGRFSFKTYAIDRASRIFLPFIPALLLTVLCDWIGMRFFSDLGFYSGAHPMIHSKIHSGPFSTYFTFETFVKNLLMLQTIAAPAFGSDQPLWTISLEFWFYVTFGVGLAGAAAQKPAQRWAGVVAALIIAAMLGRDFPIYMGLWLIGVAAGFVGLAQLERPRVACAAFFSVLAVLRLVKSEYGLGDLVMARNYLVAFAFAWLLISMRGVRWRALETAGRLNAFMASFSYSLYLVHFPLMLLLLGALHATGLFPDIARGYAPNDARGLLAYAAVASAVGLSAYLFARATEAQTPRLRSWIRARSL
jgi:peptidoglycan/LPS O-acetylase OafA/YrhL